MDDLKEKITEKLAVKENISTLNKKFVEEADAAVLKFGRISIPYLIRKLKCSHLTAKELCLYLEKTP